MGSIAMGRAVSAALDSVLEPEGFAKGQYDEGGVDGAGPIQVIFCAAHDELSDRHPGLPQGDDQERGVGACIDLVIDVTSDGVIGLLMFERFSFAETLRLIGRPHDAITLGQVEGRPLDEGLPLIAAPLGRLLFDA